MTDIQRVSPTTANKHVSNLGEYVEYLKTTRKIPRNAINPFEGLFTPRKRGRAARHERGLWPKDLNEKLFTSPAHKGCKSIHRRTIPGDEIHRDALFWVPLWGRLCGVREDEICSDDCVADLPDCICYNENLPQADAPAVAAAGLRCVNKSSVRKQATPSELREVKPKNYYHCALDSWGVNDGLDRI
jgi:hypothetical protein